MNEGETTRYEGDVVKLKSGGRSMTVRSVKGDEVCACWFGPGSQFAWGTGSGGDTLQFMTIHHSALVPDSWTAEGAR